MSHKRYISTLVCLSIIASFGTLLYQSSQIAIAQINQEEWSEPANLSRSGGTTNPILVIDSNGNVQVIWHDAYKGTVYTGYNGSEWSTPQAIQLPFSPTTFSQQPGVQIVPGPVPTLKADRTGNIHAFWTDEQNQLYDSYVPSDSFGNPGSWSAPTQLAESALDFDVAVDEQNNIHLAYVRNLDSVDFPAGIYYRQTSDSGLSWSPSTQLYQSEYFRSLTSGQANVDLTVNGDQVYLAWDNRPRKQVFITRSPDGGTTWGREEVVDSPTDENPSLNPLNMQVVGSNDELLRFWQDGDTTVSCTQYFQSSSDEGNTWSDKSVMLSSISGCPQEQYFFQDRDLLILMTTIQGQVYLLAWDGNRWSEPQSQQSLLGFQDSDTFNLVSFGCRVPDSDQGGDLFVVGCDTGNGGDIWITSRPFGNVEEWFPPASAWTTPIEIAQSDTAITSPILLSDPDGRMHAIWIQQETTTASNSGRDAIFYSQKESDQWTQPAAILQSPNGFTRQPSAVVDDNGNLYVVWSGGMGGEIYFSRASGARARIPSEWIQPVLLPSVRQIGSSPDIQIDKTGDLYVAYSIPLNEQRGIYITKSEDAGLTWSDPIMAFDASQAGWDMVDQPHLVVSENSSMYVIFTNTALPNGSGVKWLYAVYSLDGGENWSELQTIVEKPVSWNDLIESIGGNLMRAWVEPAVGGNFFQYQLSQDQGVTWSPVASISFTSDVIGNPVLTNDVANQSYLIQGFNDSRAGSYFSYWKWDGNQWALGEDLELGFSPEIQALSATVSPQGRLALIYAGFIRGFGENPDTYFLEYSDRIVELPDILPTPQPEVVIEPTATTMIDVTPLPSPTATTTVPIFPVSEPGDGSTSTGNTWIGVALGIILAGLIAVGVVAFVTFKIRS